MGGRSSSYFDIIAKMTVGLSSLLIRNSSASVCSLIFKFAFDRNSVSPIYDIKRLYSLPEIQAFLSDKDELKRLMVITKDTDSFYLSRRGVSVEYNPKGAYDFSTWKHNLDNKVKANYESLHKDLLYTDEKQFFDDALIVLEEIDTILRDIGE